MQQQFEVDKLPDEGDVPVRAALSDNKCVVQEEDLLIDAMQEMKRTGAGSAPVLSADGGVKGLLVRQDMFKTLHDGPRDQRHTVKVSAVYRRGVCVGINAPMRVAMDVFESQAVYRLPVVDGIKLVGSVSRPDIENFQQERRRFHQMYKVAELSPHERAQLTWRLAQPNATWLTWGMEISGTAFIEKAESHGAFGADKAILEIGPGYGRLLGEILQRGLPFRKYVAVDISPANVAHLKEKFDRDDVVFVQDDIEKVTLEGKFDVVLSSLTLKHLYPTFESAMSYVARHLNPGATVIFDLIEGEFGAFVPADGVSYVRGYTREELTKLLPRIPLELVTFDEVEHAPGQVRLLVVARKTS